MHWCPKTEVFKTSKSIESNSQNEPYLLHLQKKSSQRIINLQHIESSSPLPETSKIYQHPFFAPLFYLSYVGHQGDWWISISDFSPWLRLAVIGIEIIIIVDSFYLPNQRLLAKAPVEYSRFSWPTHPYQNSSIFGNLLTHLMNIFHKFEQALPVYSLLFLLLWNYWLALHIFL